MPYQHEDLSQITQHPCHDGKCNPSSGEAETGGSLVILAGSASSRLSERLVSKTKQNKKPKNKVEIELKKTSNTDL